MQYRPDAATLLGAVAEVLDDVLGDVPPAEQHRVRVAAHLARLVEREARLGTESAADEHAAIDALLGRTSADSAEAVERLSEELRTRDIDDVAFDARAWETLVDVTRRDLEIAKPGHTAWRGR